MMSPPCTLSHPVTSYTRNTYVFLVTLNQSSSGFAVPAKRLMFELPAVCYLPDSSTGIPLIGAHATHEGQNDDRCISLAVESLVHDDYGDCATCFFHFFTQTGRVEMKIIHSVWEGSGYLVCSLITTGYFSLTAFENPHGGSIMIFLWLFHMQHIMHLTCCIWLATECVSTCWLGNCDTWHFDDFCTQKCQGGNENNVHCVCEYLSCMCGYLHCVCGYLHCVCGYLHRVCGYLPCPGQTSLSEMLDQPHW